MNLPRLFARQAELLRELVNLEEVLGGALGDTLRPGPGADESPTLPAAAAFMSEPVETFRRRLDYHKALLNRPGERRLR